MDGGEEAKKFQEGTSTLPLPLLSASIGPVFCSLSI